MVWWRGVVWWCGGVVARCNVVVRWCSGLVVRCVADDGDAAAAKSTKTTTMRSTTSSNNHNNKRLDKSWDFHVVSNEMPPSGDIRTQPTHRPSCAVEGANYKPPPFPPPLFQ